MITLRVLCVLALLAVGPESAAEPPAETLTWQEANSRSAALVKDHRTMNEGADLARIAFDLYAQQAKSYSAQNHAQLLLNLVDARWKARDSVKALEELERGIETLVQRAGPADPVLIDLWRQGAAISSRERERYYGQAIAAAERAWGPDDPRTIKLSLNMVHDLRQGKGYVWAKSKLRAARSRAAVAGEDSALVAEIDLILAKLDMETGKKSVAIEGYKAVIERLEKRADREEDDTLALAYGLLEYAYDEKGNRKAAADIRQRRSERWVRPYPVKPGPTAPGQLTPLVRVTPEYPRDAFNRGRQGFVELHVDVNPDGTVADLKVLRSEPPDVFDKSAMRAVRKWKFEPKIVDGQPVASSGRQRIEYKLGGDRFRRGSD